MVVGSDVRYTRLSSDIQNIKLSVLCLSLGDVRLGCYIGYCKITEDCGNCDCWLSSDISRDYWPTRYAVTSAVRIAGKRAAAGVIAG
jgi:hypothetical protein